MREHPTFDLLLLGYRNDLARERTMALISRLASLHPLEGVARSTPLPHALCRGIDHAVGLRLCAQLRESGAQVRLVAIDAAAPEASFVRRRTPSLLQTTIVVIAVLATAWVILQPVRQLGGPVGSRGAPPNPAGPARWPEARRSAADQALNDEAIALNDSGDFAGAVERLRQALARHPDHRTMRQNLKAVLHNWAISELNAERPESAMEIARQGLEVEEDPRLLFVLGLAHFRASEWSQAQSALERAVTLGADDANTLVTLGKVYQQRGNRQGAVEMFQRARERGAAGEEFDAALRRLERELDAEWDYTELPSPHFTVSFAYEASYRAAHVVLDTLERAYVAVGRKLDLYPRERTPVVLYDREEFHDITQAPSWMGALYDGRIKLPVQGLEGESSILDRSVFHEYAHVLVSQLSQGRCPVWLNEGIAIWAEEAHEDERRAWADAVIANQQLFYLEDLERPFTKLPAARVSVAYAQSYLAVRALLREFGPRRVRELVSTLASGVPLGTAFERVLTRRLADFEDGLLRNLTG